MSLYTLKSEEEAMNPLASYGGASRWVRNQMSSLGYAPSREETRVYDAIGRSSETEGDNFFTKKGKSIENALGTTGAAIASLGNDLKENADITARDKKAKQSMNDIYKKYGYNSADDYYDASNKAEKDIFGKYGFDSDAYWDKHAEIWSPAKANSEEVKNLEATRQSVIDRMSQEDADVIRKFDSIQDELKGQSKKNADIADKAAKDYKDYRENDYISKKINQDRGKFLGSAINTLSTASDVMLPGAGIAFNTVQGGVEGIADELEQNGLENFDWGRAGQNALSGALTGAAVGALNKGVSGVLSKNGGNLFKGGNVIARGLNNLGSKTAVGRAGATLASGAARGALSGAVGGATGAGLQSAMNGVDVGQGIANALQGAAEGAKQGAVTGGIMSGANMIASKTPGIGSAMQKFNEAGEDWNARKAEGQSLGQRVGETLDESTTKRVGEKIGQRLGEDWDVTKQGFKNVGEGLGILTERAGIKDISNAKISDIINAVRGTADESILNELLKTPELRNQIINYTDNNITDQYNQNKRADIIQALQNGVDNNTDGFLMRQNIYDDANNVRIAEGKTPFEDRQTRLYGERTGQYNPENAIEGHYMKHADTLGGAEGVTDAMLQSMNGRGAQAYPAAKNSNTMFASRTANSGEFPASTILDDNLGVRSISGRSRGQMNRYDRQKSNLSGGDLSTIAPSNDGSAGSPISGRQVTSFSIPQADTNVNSRAWDSLAQDAGFKNYDDAVNSYTQFNNKTPNNASDVLDWMDNNSSNTQPETEVYRSLMGDKTSRESQLRNASGLKLQQQYGTIDKPTAKATNAPETLQKIKNAGFTKPADVERMADIVTGSNGEVSKLVSNLVETAKPINTFDGSEKGQSLSDYIDFKINRRGLDGINEGKAVKSQIDALLKSLPSRAEGSVSFIDNPADVFKLTQQLDAEAAQYEGRSGMNYGTTTPDKMRAAQVIKDVSNLLKDRIYETVDVKAALTPEVAENLKSYDPNNKAWADYVDNQIMQAKNVQDLRSVQAPWVNAKKIIDNGYMNSVTYGGRVGNALSVPTSAKGMASVLLNATLNSGPGLRAQAKVLDKAADFVANRNVGSGFDNISLPNANTSNVSSSDNPATQIYNMIGRTEGNMQGEQARTANYLADAVQNDNQQPQTIESLMTPSTSSNTSIYDTVNNTTATAPTTDTTATSTGMPTQSVSTNSYFQPTGDYWTDILGKAMSSAIDANDIEAFAALYGMYQDATAKLEKNASTNTEQVKLTDKQRQANAAALALDQLEQLEPDAAYNLSDIPLIGGIATLGGNSYESSAKSLAQQVGYMLSGANVTKEEAENIGKAYVPQPRDNDIIRQQKLDKIRGIISEYQRTYGE